VHGGYGYTRDFPVEQYWRDNRLNMIHEGTHGIQALDLLGRKVVMDGGAGLKLLAGRINDTVTRAGQHAATAQHANALAAALQKVGAATKAAWATGLPEEALANATPYLQAFGHLVLAWTWLDVALALPGVQGGSELSDDQQAFAQGKRAAMRYFFAYELPRIDAWLNVVAEREAVCRTMHDDWF
jgi:butyryl-CoA dehydrogenase